MKEQDYLNYPKPHSVFTEQQLLGSILLWGESLFKLAEMMGITATHFKGYEPHQKIWRAIALAIKTERPVDVYQVAEVLQHQGWYDECGGLPYLIKLSETAVSQDQFHALVRTMLWYERAWQIIQGCHETLKAFSLNGDWEQAQQKLLLILSSPESPFEEPSVWTAKEILELEGSLSHLIDFLLPETGILLIAGAAGVGKSLLALYFALCIAKGEDVWGKFPTTPATVLYLDGESSPSGFKRRLSLFTNQPPDNLLYTQWSGSIIEPSGRGQMEYLIRKYSPAVLILDSLIRFHDLNENDARDMKKIFSTLNWFRLNLGVAFIILQHARKTTLFGSPSDSVRGSTEITAFPDTAVLCRRPVKSNTLVVDILKMRHNEPEHTKFKIALHKEETPWRYEFMGATEEVETRIEEAIKFITDALEGGELSRQELIMRAKNQGYSQTAIDRAIRQLKADGSIIPIRKGKNTYYQLASKLPSQPSFDDSQLSIT